MNNNAKPMENPLPSLSSPPEIHSFMWHRPYTLEEIAKANDINMLAHVGLEFLEIGPDYLKGRMPVDERTKQTFGLFHGGASVVLAETLGSIGANLVLDPTTHFAVGLEVNCNHLTSARSGWVTGIAKPIRVGRTTQVWEIRMTNDEGVLTAISRLTMAVLPHPAK
jgi:1,4-dihydroxy-2-naphthoyl-CoA hydrolase